MIQWGIVIVKKDYSQGEVNVVENTQMRLHKMKKNVAIASFYCLVSKIRKRKTVFYVVIRRGKTSGLCCFLRAKR